MSSADISDAEIKALAAEIEAVSLKAKVHFKPILRAVLKAMDKPADDSPFLAKWLSQAQNVVKINASETTVPKITEVFQLGEEQKWELVENDPVEVPLILKLNLRNLKEALYDTDSEATCRIAVDLMLIECRRYLLNKHQSAETSHDTETTIADATNPSTPVANKHRSAETSHDTETTIANATNLLTPVVNKLAAKPRRRVKLFAEASLSIEMCDPFEPDRQILVTGRADRAFGYSLDGDKGALLVAIEAKRASEFSKGKAQLLTYLAILRENRLRAKKTNIITQGFYSDGSLYAFISITADGTINRSRIFEIDLAGDLKMVFNFIINMMETAMKSTPNASPTKPGQQQEKEIDEFDEQVWFKAFRHLAEEMIVKDGDNMDDVIFHGHRP